MHPDRVNGRWPLVTIFGGSGFIGRHLVRTLAKDEWNIRVACRRPDLAGHLQPLGRVGQIQCVQANLRNPESIARAVRGAEVVVNLAGVLRSAGAQTFQAVHVDGAAAVAQASRAAGARTFVHLSALGANAGSRSEYARTKAAGESAVRDILADAVIFRPSTVFGPEDNFLNRFAEMARISPILPLIGDGGTRFQPVFVGDVATAVKRAIEGAAQSEIYELGGPRIATFREIMQLVCAVTGRSRLLAPLPFAAAGGVAAINQLVAGLGILPDWAILTRDQVEMLRSDSVVSAQAAAEGRTLEGLGVSPEGMEAVARTYLWRFRKTGQYEHDRSA